MAKRSPTPIPYNPPVVTPAGLGISIPVSERIIPDDQAIRITLVNLDLYVLSGVSVRDAVRLRLQAIPIQVETLAGQRIGDVAAADDDVVRLVGNTTGRVVEAQTEGPICVIQIR